MSHGRGARDGLPITFPAAYGKELPGRGRPVLVTGTSSGLGLEIAVRLAEGGFRVYASMRDLGRSALLQSRARAAGLPIAVLELDVTDNESIRSAVSSVEAAEGSLYALVNNAGIVLRGFFEDLEDEEIRAVFATNVFGLLAVTRAVLPGMRRAGTGRVVVMGSAGGRFGSAGASAYCASKFALAGFSESLAQEVWPFGIRVILVEPGIVSTELFGRNLGVAKGALQPQSPYADMCGRLLSLSVERSRAARLTPRDVADTVAEALTARNPRSHYVLGGAVRGLLLLRRLLPEETFHRVFREIFYRKVRASARASCKDFTCPG